MVDNTNPTKADRDRYITAAKMAGYTVIGYYFRSSIGESIERNALRSGKARVPDVAVASIHAKLELPEYGEGFDGVSQRGSEQNDIFLAKDGKITTATNHSGGIQGGISNGQDIYFRVAFKPVATLLREQNTVDIEGKATTLTAKGRHDPCVLPRAVPVVEAMAAMTILDYYLLNKTGQM